MKIGAISDYSSLPCEECGESFTVAKWAEKAKMDAEKAQLDAQEQRQATLLKMSEKELLLEIVKHSE